jgi:hypothetical protein
LTNVEPADHQRVGNIHHRGNRHRVDDCRAETARPQ